MRLDPRIRLQDDRKGLYLRSVDGNRGIGQAGEFSVCAPEHRHSGPACQSGYGPTPALSPYRFNADIANTIGFAPISSEVVSPCITRRTRSSTCPRALAGSERRQEHRLERKRGDSRSWRDGLRRGKTGEESAGNQDPRNDAADDGMCVHMACRNLRLTWCARIDVHSPIVAFEGIAGIDNAFAPGKSARSLLMSLLPAVSLQPLAVFMPRYLLAPFLYD